MNDKEEACKPRERARFQIVSNRDEKQRKWGGGGGGGGDNRFTTEPNQFPFLTWSRPADDYEHSRGHLAPSLLSPLQIRHLWIHDMRTVWRESAGIIGQTISRDTQNS